MLDLCLLGTGGMMPLPKRWLTSLLVRYQGRMLLIDAGEGTQIPLRMLEWGFKNLDLILFTHYHADHVSGLPGLLLTLGNSGREEPLLLAGPPGIKEVVAGLTVIAPQLPYELKLLELAGNQNSEILFNDLIIKSTPVEHTLSCLAYTIELKRAGKFDLERAKAEQIPVQYWKCLQKGEQIVLGERTISPEMVLGQPRKGLKLGYCTDTRPTEGLKDFLSEVDLLICEGMYGDEADAEKAVQKKHMSFQEAARLATTAKVKELWLTHYSPALTDPEEYLEVARVIFANTLAGKDLLTKTLKFEE